ncbi:MAG: hypothetical protein ABIQ65_08250 [Thermoanaerobaculia bacterium]
MTTIGWKRHPGTYREFWAVYVRAGILFWFLALTVIFRTQYAALSKDGLIIVFVGVYLLVALVALAFEIAFHRMRFAVVRTDFQAGVILSCGRDCVVVTPQEFVNVAFIDTRGWIYIRGTTLRITNRHFAYRRLKSMLGLKGSDGSASVGLKKGHGA